MDSQLNTISTAGKVNTSALTGQIANANLAQLVTPALVSGAALTLLPNIPSGAGIIPKANIGSLLGTWAAAVTSGTSPIGPFLAATDLFVTATIDNGTLHGYTDASNPPTTQRTEATSGSHAGISFPVRKGDYWEVSGPDWGTATVYSIPLGSLLCGYTTS